MTASSSGRRMEPPNTVMVPSQLMTVLIPSSSYGLPDRPNPLTLLVVFHAKSLPGDISDPAPNPKLPRKLRRFHFKLSCMMSAPYARPAERTTETSCFEGAWLQPCRKQANTNPGLQPPRQPKLLPDHSRSAVNFNQRLPRKRSHSHRRPCRSAVGEISFEDLIHRIVVRQVGEIDRKLQYAIHAAATSFDQPFYVLHHLGDVAVDVILAHRAVRVRSLAGDVDDTVVNDQWRDEIVLVG